MARRRLLLLLKPLDVYPVAQLTNPQKLRILHYLENRRRVHKDAINFCQNILRQKPVEWKPIVRNNLSEPIRDVDLVITVGGDGTLLQGSHFIDDLVPVLGVNSDPTQPEEVEKLRNEFDANRSTGYLCGATVNNFEQALDNVLEGRANPSKLTRISIRVNSKVLPTYALNDILISHPCPAALSQLSFKIKRDDQPCSLLVHSQSSGLRVSTAAMLSAGWISDAHLISGSPVYGKRAHFTRKHLELDARINQISSVHGSDVVVQRGCHIHRRFSCLLFHTRWQCH